MLLRVTANLPLSAWNCTMCVANRTLISPERKSRCPYSCWMLPRSRISHRNQPEHFPSINPPGQVPVQFQRASPPTTTANRYPWTNAQLITPWVNSAVVTINPSGTIRLFLDPRDLNKAIQRTPYSVRTIDDVIPKASGASHFSISEAILSFKCFE